MTSGFLLLFVESAHALYDNTLDHCGQSAISFRSFEIPPCVLRNMTRMMKSNPSLKADEFLNA
eukprot:3334090-Rhodomonas_salina.2